MIESIIAVITFVVIFISVVILCIAVVRENKSNHELLEITNEVFELNEHVIDLVKGIELRVRVIENMIQEDDLK